MSDGLVVVVGDALLDRDVEGTVERVCPEAPVPVLDETHQRARPGGAALAAALAAGDGRPVVLVTALAGDRSGRELARVIRQAGVETVDLGLEGETPEKIRLRSDGHLLVRLDRGARGGRIGPLTDAARDALARAAVVLVSDYGRGLAAAGDVRGELSGVAVRTPLVWDPHPLGPEPLRGAALVTPNRREAGGANAGAAHTLRERWGARALAVTLGERGALLVDEAGGELQVPAPAVSGGDPCGAGDRFASAAAGLLADGLPVAEAVAGAVRVASSFVAGGGAGSLGSPVVRAGQLDAAALAAEVRARGGTIVATGGCFDLLHAGHVATLEAARFLGDCLIVCLNSDASIRSLKGPDRPVVPEDDRAAVLRGLAAVDAVVVFDENTPEAALERLRPDVWAKGGDYAVAELPEARLVASWGGRCVILPYVAGRSTTRLIAEAQLRGT